MADIAFWVSALVVIYIYLGYPALVWLLARGRSETIVAPDDFQPTVAVLIAAYDEAEHIDATVRNKLQSDYPEALLEVIVVSDESSDGTDDIVRSIDGRVRLLRQAPRAGKTQALNTAIAETDAEIIVFSDANSLYAADAIGQLVARFADGDVGYVTGKMVYVAADGGLVGDGCSAYMRYENFIRAQESRLGAVIGVDGGIDAVRRRDYTPMRADQQPDFVQPLSILEQGHKVVYEPGALLKEHALDDSDSEYRMRVRVTLRALWALWDKRALLNPLRFGLISLQLWSHKVLRYFAFVPLVIALVSNAWLAVGSAGYSWLLFVHLLFYGLAYLGYRDGGRRIRGVFALPAYFVLINAAAAHAVLRMFGGERMAMWNPRVGA